MTARKSLHAVGDNETAPAPVTPKTVTQAATSGTTRELLVAMRTRIAEAVEDKNTPARELASLTKRLVEVVRDIEAIDARETQEASDGGATVEDGVFNPAAV